KLGAHVQKPARDATFAVDGPKVSIVPDRPGIRLDAVQTAQAVLAAALRRSPERRVARLPIQSEPAKLTAAAARGMGINGLVSTYTTEYGGVPNRIHNVQLVARLVDDKLIAPGAEFSFNKTTGERTAAKGFLVAPVIVNGEVTTGLGGGVCQVSTTVDPTLKPGEQVIDDSGEPAMTTSVTRDVYAADGKLLYHDVWSSYYRAAPELLRVGPKKKKPARPVTVTTPQSG